MCIYLRKQQLILNLDIVLLLIAFGVNIGGQLNPFIFVQFGGATIIIRITIVYTDNNSADPTAQLTEMFDVEVVPDDWNEPCSYTDNCVVFENDEILMFAPPTVDGFSVLSMDSVNAFTADSDVNVLSTKCDLRCADATACDEFEPTPGALDPEGPGIDFGVPQQSTFNNGFCNPSIFDDPHVAGLRGQRYDWAGEDGGWYAFLSTDLLQMNLRVSSYLPDTFPDRQLVTGVALITSGGHSVTLEVSDPLDLTPTCNDHDTAGGARCLVGGALRVTVDGRDEVQHTGEFHFDGDIDITAVNLPLECQRFGDHRMWVNLPEEQKLMHPGKRDLRAARGATSFSDWLRSDEVMIAAPWCDRYLETLAGDMAALAGHRSEHAVFRIGTPDLSLRVNVGINGEEQQTLEDGRIVPASTFWQMDVNVEHGVGLSTAKGMLGETSRYVLDATGKPVMVGLDVLRGEVEDYRVMHPLGTDFKQMFVQEQD